MATLSFTVPAGKTAGYKIGSLPIPAGGGLHAAVISTNFAVGVDGSVYVNNVSYNTISYPHVWNFSYAGVAHTLTFLKASIVGWTSSLIYVDPVNGDNLSLGTVQDPISSLSLAMERVRGAGVVIMYEGSYGDITLGDKPWKAYG
jgi:hypothetical protein